MTLQIGSLSLTAPVVLAPMAGVTDAPFRVLCAEQGGGLFVSEMVSARGLVQGSARTWQMTRHHPAERIRSLQLYGSDPTVVAEAVRMLVDRAGVDHIGRIVAAAVRSAGGVPVTVKMRMGLDDERLTYRDAGRIAAAEGAAAVALHARTAAQGYAGAARWSAIGHLRAAVRQEADVPVLGNRDIWAADDAVTMMAATRCDGVVVGRGCVGRPWLFADLARRLRQDPAVRTRPGPPPLGAVVPLVRRHLEPALDHGTEEAATLRRFRKHLRWYLQGYPVGRRVHSLAGTVAQARDVDHLLADFDPALTVVAGAARAPRGRTGGVGRMVLPPGWCDEPDADTTVADPVGAASGG